jgi:hypothetical protein
MENGFALLPQSLLIKQAVNELVECNQMTLHYGLMLLPSEAVELVQARDEALARSGRIEFGGGMLKKLIEKFCSSPYLNRQDYLETLGELTEIFYYFKNESLDGISDDELISLMKECFDSRCGGSIELLQGREMERIARNVRYGDAADTGSGLEYDEDSGGEEWI